MKAYVINRAIDHHRLNNVLVQAQRVPALDLERVEACDGHAADFDPQGAFPEVFGPRFRLPEAREERARIAIFLSHLTCWRRIAGGADPYALILEDDSQIDPDIGGLGETLPQRFDLVFCNERMGAYRNHLPDERNQGFVPVDEMHKYYAEALAADEFERVRISQRGILKTAPGGEGYILSREGAATLLANVRGVASLPHVDAFLYVSTVNVATFENHANSPRVSRNVHNNFPRRRDLLGYIAPKPMVRTEPRFLSGSVRRQEGSGQLARRPSDKPVRLERDPTDRVVIHIGFHKTGTTFLQDFLLENQRAFAAHFLMLNQRLRTSSALAKAAQAIHRRMDQGKDAGRFLDDIAREANGIRDLARSLGKGVVISDEEMAGYLPGRGAFTALYPALPTIGRALVDGFAPMRVEFVLYTREMEAWARSSYNQCVKMHGHTGSLEDYLAGVIGGQTLAASAEALCAAVGRERVRIVEMEREGAREGGVAEGFCEILGVAPADLANLAIPGRVNESLPEGALQFMRLLNEKNLDAEASRIVRLVVRENPALFRKDPPAAPKD